MYCRVAGTLPHHPPCNPLGILPLLSPTTPLATVLRRLVALMKTSHTYKELKL